MQVSRFSYVCRRQAGGRVWSSSSAQCRCLLRLTTWLCPWYVVSYVLLVIVICNEYVEYWTVVTDIYDAKGGDKVHEPSSWPKSVGLSKSPGSMV